MPDIYTGEDTVRGKDKRTRTLRFSDDIEIKAEIENRF